METVIIPTRGDIANYDQSIELDGTVFNLKFRYNDRDSAWYLSIHDVDNVPIRSGLKLIPNLALLRQLVSEGRPLGELVVVDTRAIPLPPSLAELGSKVQLTYFGLDP